VARFLTLRYVSQFVLVVSPLLAGNWSLLDWLGYVPDEDGNVRVAGLVALTGAKSAVEFKLRAIVSMTIFALALVNEAVAVGLPVSRLRAFRQRYLDQYKTDWDDMLGGGCRVNVMFIRRRIWTLGVPYFEWTWSNHFDPPHHRDANMVMLKWQGVAGAAVRAQATRSAYFQPEQPALRRLSKPYWLTGHQIRRTSHLNGIISVPILRKVSGSSPGFKCVGVINVDAVTPRAAEKLRRNEQTIANYFTEFGILLGDLSL
jgi:hypothetical protein